MQIVDQMAFLFVADDDFEIEPDVVGDAVAATERVAEVLDAVIAHVEACEWSVEAIDLRPAIEALGLKPRKVMAAVYAAIEGHATGASRCSTRSSLLGRERIARPPPQRPARASADPIGPGSARDPVID